MLRAMTILCFDVVRCHEIISTRCFMLVGLFIIFSIGSLCRYVSRQIFLHLVHHTLIAWAAGKFPRLVTVIARRGRDLRVASCRRTRRSTVRWTLAGSATTSYCMDAKTCNYGVKNALYSARNCGTIQVAPQPIHLLAITKKKIRHCFFKYVSAPAQNDGDYMLRDSRHA